MMVKLSIFHRESPQHVLFELLSNAKNLVHALKDLENIHIERGIHFGKYFMAKKCPSCENTQGPSINYVRT